MKSLHPLVRHFAAGLSCLALACGCSNLDADGDPEVPDSPVEQAKLVTEMRERAQYWLDIFLNSDGQDLEALTKYSTFHRRTVKVAPTSCPLCYVNYGVSLSRVGLYYETLIELLRAEANALPPGERSVLDQKIKDYTKKARDAYVLSNKQFEVYFRSSTTVDPRTYEWVFRQYAALGDFNRALYYLDLFRANGKLSEVGKENAKLLEKRYQRALRLQQESDFEQELHGELRDRRSLETDEGSGLAN